MKCPLCNVEARITKTYITVEGDESPNTETKVHNVQEITCMNKNCSNYQKMIARQKHKLNIS